MTGTPEGPAAGSGSVGSVLAGRFRELTGGWPDGVWRAPGRVNLIGEHTDYNAGLALPFALDRDLRVALRRRPDRRVRCWSAQVRGHAEVDLEAIDRDTIDRDAVPVWARYPVGVLWAFARAGFDLPGVDLLVDSAIPLGGGLSSSAALEAAVAVALSEVTGTDLDRRHLVELCHSAEAEFVAAPVGTLDQFAVLCGRAGHGLLIDFRSFEFDYLPLPPRMGPIVVVNTNVRHRTADGGYAARRRSCQQAAEQLGVADLRGATVERIDDRLEGELARRARHVVTENERVLEADRRLLAGVAIGDLLFASHASLRDDFEVSCPELDGVVEMAGRLGADGARLTGAGFGGCAIVLGRSAGELAPALESMFSSAGWARPAVFGVVAADGAGRLS